MTQVPIESLNQNLIKKTAIFALILSLILLTAMPALGNEDDENDFLVPDRGYSVDYYRSYGEPVMQASIVGDPELSRGETADLQITVSNIGAIDGFKRLNVNQAKLTDSAEEMLATTELEEEKEFTTAKDLQTNLVSESEYISVEATNNVQSIEELETGDTANLRYTIKIDGNTPAGNYELLLPVNYEYQANVRTATADIINLGVTDTAFIREYKTKNETLKIPVSVKSEPKLEITNVSGSLKQGETQAIKVTYTNTRESVANDSIARIIVMSPLSAEKSIVRLGDIGPGENKTASFNISADQEALVKNYGINSEIKFIDEDGETSFSENMKIHVPLEATDKKISTTGIAIILILVIGLYQIINVHRKRKQSNEKDENASGDDNE
ncbi:MAG: COG1361 S-layer family protein [Methanosarcina sp.]